MLSGIDRVSLTVIYRACFSVMEKLDSAEPVEAVFLERIEMLVKKPLFDCLSLIGSNNQDRSIAALEHSIIARRKSVRLKP